MKKHIALFGTTLLLGSLLGGTGVLAQEETQAEANPKTATTSVTGKLQLSENGGFNPNIPSPDLNDKTSVPNNSYFGISYKPTTFNIGNDVKLADTNEEQNIVMYGPTGSASSSGSEDFHVAVKDKTRLNNRKWTLNAKLDSAIDQADLGISIKTGTTGNSVKRNINNGTDDFKSSDLIDQVKKDNNGDEVTNKADITITATDTDVMKAVENKFVNGVYDLKLPQVELHIPNASKVKAQTLETNITWTLTNAAQ
ncbi:hypothetical protein C6P52_12435 [Enterococcus mundtii]|uniref:WxL domain-containing protein n=1 Tax=Enterococcus mundtii TaxID=53346 RepID=UPI000D37863E|nr:WxL domain-containing protein [Enterococcus mundtii]PTO37550.1 hypothetical protein C6P52_12435 [Enterococcus mundtii]PTO39204.1 hypothetical protein C6P54_14835 [Enterococcus mundtii]